MYYFAVKGKVNGKPALFFSHVTRLPKDLDYVMKKIIDLNFEEPSLILTAPVDREKEVMSAFAETQSNIIKEAVKNGKVKIFLRNEGSDAKVIINKEGMLFREEGSEPLVFLWRHIKNEKIPDIDQLKDISSQL